MAWQLKNTIKFNSQSGLQQTNDHMPRRRKRHYGKMSLMPMIFVSCCLTLILSPLHVQAKELNNTTSKGENMLSNDLQSHQLKEGEANTETDKTNDNGTFKRLTQTPMKMENEHLADQGEEQEQEQEEEEEDEHSTEVIEMIQPTHNLRHQEHYKQRILLAERYKQQKLHLTGNAKNYGNEGDNDGEDPNAEDEDDDMEKQERELTQHNRNLRYQQIQKALREPTVAHHRRHEHHLAMKKQQQHQQRWPKQTELTWPPAPPPPQQHHLRHQHHQQQQLQELQHQPQLRHLKHEMRKQNMTNAKIQTLLHQRYFDRESSYINPMTTEGPHLRHEGSYLNWKPVAHIPNNPHNRLFNDDSHNNQKLPEEEEEEVEKDIKRFSLTLHGHENEPNDKTNLKEKNTANIEIFNDDDAGDKEFKADIDTDDYSYEDDDAEDKDNDHKEINKPNNSPYITSYTKTNVKRYTNPLQQLHNKPSYLIPSRQSQNSNGGHHLRHTASSSAFNINPFKTNLPNDKDNADDYEDDIEKNEDENSSSEDLSAGDDAEDDEDDDDKLSDEKWNKIEHEHYRKQLQHQRAMQALRTRRPQNDNTPTPTHQHQHQQQHAAAAATITTTTINNNKYSSYSPSSLSAASTNNAAWKKRQTINEDESDNIYSRYYVPGSVTRKKEEELGSPQAILESRRQYALQQRQNKALASAHHRRIVTEGFCRLPQPRVERIRKDSWKIYTPHCTILHRCADDAGCCPSERQTCAPKRTKNVDLYFFVISLNETQGSIEKLTFVNHTECHCINRSKQRAPEYASSGAKDLIGYNNQMSYLRRATILNCFCPNLFEKILQEDGFCRCDCSSGNMGCDWLKRGMEHFSMNDRKCIMEGRCKLPTCEYGQYIKKHGRCPRREERHLSGDIDW